MGFQDRPYYHQDQPYGRPGGGMPSIGLPRLTLMVKYLLLINVGVFVLQVLRPGALSQFFAASGKSPEDAIQLWRLISFQFLHADFLRHLFPNMLGLYFFGTILERTWGSRKLLYYYLTCGAVGGTLFVLASLFGHFGGLPLIGASGGVLGLMAACAILFPQIKVFLYFLFPIPIRILAVVITVGYIWNVVRRGDNAGGDMCHLGGMATGFIWVVVWPYFDRARRQRRQVNRQQQPRRQGEHDREVDRILAKVHQQGIQSLTRREKQILQEATDRQRRR